MTARLRLLKVIVQPVFVIDDGETLVEQAAQPVIVAGHDWVEFATTTFSDAMDQLREQIESEAHDAAQQHQDD